MEAEFIQEGNALDYTPIADKVAGDVVQRAGLCGVVINDIVANDKGAVQITGVIKVPIATGVSFTEGAEVEWDDTGKEAVAATSGDFDMGRAVDAASQAADGHVLVLLNSA